MLKVVKAFLLIAVIASGGCVSGQQRIIEDGRVDFELPKIHVDVDSEFKYLGTESWTNDGCYTDKMKAGGPKIANENYLLGRKSDFNNLGDIVFVSIQKLTSSRVVWNYDWVSEYSHFMDGKESIPNAGEVSYIITTDCLPEWVRHIAGKNWMHCNDKYLYKIYGLRYSNRTRYFVAYAVDISDIPGAWDNKALWNEQQRQAIHRLQEESVTIFQ